MNKITKTEAIRLKRKFGDLAPDVVKEILKVVTKPWSTGYWQSVKSELKKSKDSEKTVISKALFDKHHKKKPLN